MKNAATALIVALLVSLALPISDARAMVFGEEQLAKVFSIRVYVDDQVKGDCFSRPGVLKTEAELLLRRSGIQINDDAPTALFFTVLGGIGNVIGNRCVVTLHALMFKKEFLLDKSRAAVLLYTRSGLFMRPRAEMQEVLRTTVNELVTGLANEILKARADTSS